MFRYIAPLAVAVAVVTAAHAQTGSNGAADPTAPVPIAPNATYGNTDPATPAVPVYPQPDGGTNATDPGTSCPSVLVNRGIDQEEALRMCAEIEQGKNK